MSEALQAHVWPDMTMKSGAPGERSSVHTVANVVDTTGEVKQDESQPGEEKGVLSKHTSSSISATAAERDSSQRRIGGVMHRGGGVMHRGGGGMHRGGGVMHRGGGNSKKLTTVFTGITGAFFPLPQTIFCSRRRSFWPVA